MFLNYTSLQRNNKLFDYNLAVQIVHKQTFPHRQVLGTVHYLKQVFTYAVCLSNIKNVKNTYYIVTYYYSGFIFLFEEHSFVKIFILMYRQLLRMKKETMPFSKQLNGIQYILTLIQFSFLWTDLNQTWYSTVTFGTEK